MDKIKNHLIEELNDICIVEKYSINMLANKSGMHYPGVYKILHGEQIPQINTFEKLLDAMGYKLVIAPKD